MSCHYNGWHVFIAGILAMLLGFCTAGVVDCAYERKYEPEPIAAFEEISMDTMRSISIRVVRHIATGYCFIISRAGADGIAITETSTDVCDTSKGDYVYPGNKETRRSQ